MSVPNLTKSDQERMGALAMSYKSRGCWVIWEVADRSFAYPADSMDLLLLQTILLHGKLEDTGPRAGLGLILSLNSSNNDTSLILDCVIK